MDGGHHKWRLMEPSSLATGQFFYSFQSFFVNKDIFSTNINTNLYHVLGVPLKNDSEKDFL